MEDWQGTETVVPAELHAAGGHRIHVYCSLPCLTDVYAGVAAPQKRIAVKTGQNPQRYSATTLAPINTNGVADHEAEADS